MPILVYIFTIPIRLLATVITFLVITIFGIGYCLFNLFNWDDTERIRELNEDMLAFIKNLWRF